MAFVNTYRMNIVFLTYFLHNIGMFYMIRVSFWSEATCLPAGKIESHGIAITDWDPIEVVASPG